LWDFGSAEPATDLGHFVPTGVRLMVKPFQENQLGLHLHGLHCT
jgi:hypothetical protein